LIDKVEIAYDEDWNKKHRKSISSAYGSAAYFIHYADLMLLPYDQQYKYLYDWNLANCRNLIKALNLEIAIVETENYQSQIPDLVDLRNNDQQMHEKMRLIIPEHISYPQVFGYKYPFQGNLSGLDLLFCMGPYSGDYLNSLSKHLLSDLS